MWFDSQMVPNTFLTSSPSVVIAGNKIYCFYRGIEQHGPLWFNVLENNRWKGDEMVPRTNLSSYPSAVEMDGKIYCFHRGEGKDSRLWYNVYEPPGWSGHGYESGRWLGEKVVPNTYLTDGPGATVFQGGHIYCFHQGDKNDGTLWYNSLTSSGWSGDRRVFGLAISLDPCAVSARNKV
ncbi:hypothetical protein MY11210_009575 [Beauveria gryllotalpidicola]